MKEQTFTIPEHKKHVSGIGSKIFGVMGIFGGGLFCITGIGAILGIPAILGSLAIMSDSESLEGECPHCGGKVSAAAKLPGADCPACKKRIVIRERKFYSVE